MSINTEIDRLENNRNAIRVALISRGVEASSHTTDDFANDILAIPSGGGGTDVSDTTATASDVLDNKYFYTSNGVRTKGEISKNTDSGNVTLTPTTSEVSKSYSAGYYPNEHGAMVEALESLIPNTDGQAISSGELYKASADGYAISDYESIVPSQTGKAFNAGFTKMASSGYAYSVRPSGIVTYIYRNGSFENDYDDTCFNLPSSLVTYEGNNVVLKGGTSSGYFGFGIQVNSDIYKGIAFVVEEYSNSATVGTNKMYGYGKKLNNGNGEAYEYPISTQSAKYTFIQFESIGDIYAGIKMGGITTIKISEIYLIPR